MHRSPAARPGSFRLRPCLQVGSGPRHDLAASVRRRASGFHPHASAPPCPLEGVAFAGRGTIHRALPSRRARRSHAPTSGRPAAARHPLYSILQTRYSDLKSAATRHPKRCLHLCTFARGSAAVAPLHFLSLIHRASEPPCLSFVLRVLVPTGPRVLESCPPLESRPPILDTLYSILRLRFWARASPDAQNLNPPLSPVFS